MRWQKDVGEKPLLKLLGKGAGRSFDEKAAEPLAGAIFLLEQTPVHKRLGKFENSSNRVFVGVQFFLLDVGCQTATFPPLPYQVVHVVNTTISCDSMQTELPFIFVTFLGNLTE